MNLLGDGQSRRENKTSELEDRFTEIMQTEIETGKKKTTGKKNRATNTHSTILYVIRIPNREERMKQGKKKKK